MNIAQIKERCTRFVELKSAIARNRGDYESIQDGLNQLSSELPVDIEYLLSIIEQAQHAIWRISTLNIPAPIHIFKTDVEAIQSFAKEALKAIQGDET